MALLFVESFDGYSTSETSARGWMISDGVLTIAAGAGRWGSNGGQFTNTKISKTIVSSPLVSGGVGFAFKKTTGSSMSSFTIFSITDGTTEQISIRTNASGVPTVNRSSTVLATGSTIMAMHTWYYIELKFTIDTTAGMIELRMNNAVEVASTGGLNTQATANASWSGIYLTTGTGVTHVFDDIYLVDLTGSAPTNDLLGDIRVEAIFPTGNGNSSGFVGSDGNSTDNYALVDEAPPSTSDYVGSGVPGAKDTYAFSNLSSPDGTVYAVQTMPFAAKTDAGSRDIVTVARLSGTEEDGPTMALGTQAIYRPDIRETKPGGGAWAIADVNAAEFGIKVV